MSDEISKGRILGIGGIFFKSDQPDQLRDWYQQKLGVAAGPEGHMFPWRQHDAPDTELFTVWSVFPSSSKYMDAPFMINYIVDDLDALLAKISSAGVRIDPKREDHEYGRFAWIYDLDGHKIELWQPPKPDA